MVQVKCDFSDDSIDLQWIRYWLISFSMVVIAFMEATMASEGVDKLNSAIIQRIKPTTINTLQNLPKVVTSPS